MAKTRSLRMKLNIGLDDFKEYGLPPSPSSGDDDPLPPLEGEIVEADERQAKILMDVLQVAETEEQYEDRMRTEEAQKVRLARLNPPPPAAVSDVRVRTAERATVPGVNRVMEENAREAIDEIGRMTSPEKLQEIADRDERVTVKDAAKKRLDSLSGKK